MRTAEDFDLPAGGGHISRRSMLKAGAHAAWVVPAIQVVGAAPAFATCSGAAHQHAFSFTKVSTSWDLQGNSSNKYVLTITFRISDSDPCPMPGLLVYLQAPTEWKGIQDHSTAREYAATKVKVPGSDDMWRFSPVLESPGHWFVEMKVQVSDNAVHHGTMQLTASLDGHSETTTFTV
jgi:hypothetical protein